MVILGIDPGSVRIGYGVIKSDCGKLSYINGGLLKVKTEDGNALRLIALENDLRKVIKKYRPDRAGIEKLFFVKNKKTAMAVSEARGVILKAVADCGVRVFEPTPLQAKQATTGYGNADKRAVAKMVQKILNIPEEKFIDDATDALAIAIAISGRAPIK